MSISFGSTGRKPYVGSKEVQEAYVGGQKVYGSVNKVIFHNVDGNNYEIADYVSFGGDATIKGYFGQYHYINIPYSDSGSNFCLLNKAGGTKLKLNARISALTAGGGNVVFYQGSQIIGTYPITRASSSTNYQDFTIDIPSGTTRMVLNSVTGGSGNYFYIKEAEYI